MAKISRPRSGSLQYWPRKRAEKAVPRVNWTTIDKKEEGILGFLSYKVGMGSAIVKDKTDKSLTANKKIVLPVTILEVPKHKIFSVRFYHGGRVVKDVVVSNEPILKRIMRVPNKVHEMHAPKEWDEIRLIIYTVMKNMFKKTPTIAEVAIRGKDALEKVKGLIGKELSLQDFFKLGLVDVRGLTTGKGLSGPVKRFGISLKFHKSEKGVRRPGSLAPWHPARVTFRAPMAGQLGMFTRVQNNLKIMAQGTSGQGFIKENQVFKNYGIVGGDYIVVKGSVQGPAKREILITPAFRPTRKTAKKNYELVELKV